MNINDINSFWLVLENRQNFLLYFDIGANSGVLCRGVEEGANRPFKRTEYFTYLNH